MGQIWDNSTSERLFMESWITNFPSDDYLIFRDPEFARCFIVIVAALLLLLLVKMSILKSEEWGSDKPGWARLSRPWDQDMSLYQSHCVLSMSGTECDCASSPSFPHLQDPCLQLDLEPWGVNSLFMIGSRAERFRYPVDHCLTHLSGIMTSNSIDISLFTYVNRYQALLKSGHFRLLQPAVGSTVALDILR